MDGVQWGTKDLSVGLLAAVHILTRTAGSLPNAYTLARSQHSSWRSCTHGAVLKPHHSTKQQLPNGAAGRVAPHRLHW